MKPPLKELKARLYGRSWGQLVWRHLHEQREDLRVLATEHTRDLLPPPLPELWWEIVENWLEEGRYRDLWEEDAASVMARIMDDANGWAEAAGVSLDDNARWNYFNYVALSLASAAHNDESIRNVAGLVLLPGLPFACESGHSFIVQLNPAIEQRPMESVTVTQPVEDLSPPEAEELKRWRYSSPRSAGGLNDVVSKWYGPLGGRISARVTEDAPETGDDVLAIMVATPTEADRAAAWQCYEFGTFFWEGGHPQAAVPQFTEAVLRWPLEPRFHRALGQASIEAGYPEDAEVSLLTALSLDPADQIARTALGGLYLTRGRLALAEQLYRQVVAEHETSLSLVNLATALAKQGALEVAARYCRRALELDEENERARIGLALYGDASRTR